MIQVAHGRLGKQIAGDIGIRLMHKMKARAATELSRMADKLKLVPT